MRSTLDPAKGSQVVEVGVQLPIARGAVHEGVAKVRKIAETSGGSLDIAENAAPIRRRLPVNWTDRPPGLGTSCPEYFPSEGPAPIPAAPAAPIQPLANSDSAWRTLKPTVWCAGNLPSQRALLAL